MRIEQLRNKLNYTQSDFADIMNMHRVNYNKRIQGQAEFKAVEIALLAEELDLSTDYFLNLNYDTQEQVRLAYIKELEGLNKTKTQKATPRVNVVMNLPVEEGVVFNAEIEKKILDLISN
eukprot:CAMPEP_0118680734 /NCGR_PEP_ID=MMETSP0800-20121206/4537_1 /TAXON_ID=210618 ORGANISM="Striatella unipunctata, Strain CCMP2910" /NCGR_SAMPLE_ID=MMETSP0800 /ASSEMBLY_ACC=CAM_ASM_000638 /LENGTH=119 /DNA_ID=CAMNT_0006576931 /DNA_START=111 /DNA_END=470 /DNA_ORIENTATION=-